jgi:hypothetical protein
VILGESGDRYKVKDLESKSPKIVFEVIEGSDSTTTTSAR